MTMTMTMKGGPEKWRWFLHDEGLLTSESRAALDATTATVKDILEMQEEPIPMLPTIEMALRWLESAQNHRLPALQFALERAQKTLHVMDEKVQYQQVLVGRRKRPQSTTTFARGVPQKSSLDTFQVVWAAHCGVIEEARMYYERVGCPKEDVGSHPWQILPSLLLEDTSVVWTVDRMQLLRLDVTELVSFLECRRLFANKLLVRVTDTEDTSRLEEWELSLQKLLEETTKRCVALSIQPTISPSDLLLLEQRLQESKDHLAEAERQQQSAKDALAVKKEELEAVQRHVMMVKSQLEKEITVLLQLDNDDFICIQLNMNGT